MKVSNTIVGASLVATLMTLPAIAQNAANQISAGELALVGTATLTPPGAISRTRVESGKKPPEHDVDLSAARLSSARGAPPARVLTFPTAPDSAVSNAATGLGFPGLTHLDQWTVGTGIYTDSQSSKEPPDQGLAVGNGFVMEAVNTAVAVYNQRGTLLTAPTPLSQFFHLKPEISASGDFGDLVTDPTCYFDQQTQRWFITATQIARNPTTAELIPRAHILIAVSKTSSPTGEFNLFSIDATDDGDRGTQHHPGCPCFGDQPHVGADANGFYISTNEFDIASETVFNGAQIYAMSKKRLADGRPSAVVHFGYLPIAEGLAFSVQPATSSRWQQKSNEDSEDSDDRAGGVEYFLSTLNMFNQLDNRIVVWAMSNTASLSNSSPNVTLTKVIITSEVYGFPPSAEQKWGPTPLRNILASLGDHEPLEKLHTNNDRMQPVVYADGKLWGGLNTVVQQRNGPRAGIAFFAVTAAMRGGVLKAEIARQGYLSVPGNDVLNPAIGVDGDGNAAMVFTLAGPDFFPSAAFVKITGDEKKLTVHVVAPGVAPEDGLTGYTFFDPNAGGVARWGDYSAATTDEYGKIWIATEFIPTKSSGIPGTGTFFAHWGTFIAKVAGEDD